MRLALDFAVACLTIAGLVILLVTGVGLTALAATFAVLALGAAWPVVVIAGLMAAILTLVSRVGPTPAPEAA